MNYAYDQNRQLIYLTTPQQAQQLMTQTEDTFNCPDCGQALVIRFSTTGRPFFSHQQKQPLANLESQLHQFGKQVLMQGLTQLEIAAKLEVTSQNKARRADVAVLYKGQKIALEWQCAQISTASIYRRTQSYQRQGIMVYWLLGPRYHFNGRLTQAQRQFLNYRKDLGFYLVFFDPKRANFCLIHHIRQLELTTKVIYQRQYLTLTQGLSCLIKGAGLPVKRVPTLDTRTVQMKRQCINQKLQRRDKRFQALQAQCYKAHHQLQQLPASCFEAQGLPPLYPGAGCIVNVQLLLILERQSHWTYTAIYREFEQLLLPGQTTVLHKKYWVDRLLKALLARFLDEKILQFSDQRFKVDAIRLQGW
ncbi:competence protein CoiA [Agrilactobacillus yilanensis]|uniref:Competence protein CoiA n=1 Tax=Agrilactobacillus yilanensis TaxID=2485997 RepID=A0ABW4J919_9LACO|nr:competence protein CoiA family protein [Agrilactobacillus yilanensis]